jgi:acetoacetyl-CoA reductase/3-oxoacyl-[acyl-carrier protein] reductase
MYLITGASRGIGKYLYDSLRKAGELVYGTYCSTQPMNDEKQTMAKVDVSDHQQVLDWIGSFTSELHGINLINCAGTNYNAVLHKADATCWEKVIRVNLLGAFNTIQSVLPLMREQGYGRIINFSSVVAQTAVPGTSAYAASKSGLWGLTKSVSAENARKGITINCLNLGYYNVGMIDEVPPDYLTKIKGNIPSGELGKPENVLQAVLFLVENDYVNGTAIDINGGLH